MLKIKRIKESSGPSSGSRPVKTKRVRVITESQAKEPTLRRSPDPMPAAPAPPGPSSPDPYLMRSLQERMAELKRARGKLSSSIFEMVFGHTNAPTIDIGSALAHFDNTVTEDNSKVMEYDIMFLAIERGTGNVYVRTMRARKNVQSPKRQMKNRPERGKQMHNLKYAGTMLLHDTQRDRTRTIKTRMIFAFKFPEDTAWCRVADRPGRLKGKPGPTKQVYEQAQMNELYHQIDDYQPQIQQVFNQIRSLESTGHLPTAVQPAASKDLATLKEKRRKLNDLISKTKAKLQDKAKKPTAERVLIWQEKLALAEVERDEVNDKIKDIT